MQEKMFFECTGLISLANDYFDYSPVHNDTRAYIIYDINFKVEQIKNIKDWNKAYQKTVEDFMEMYYTLFNTFWEY